MLSPQAKYFFEGAPVAEVSDVIVSLAAGNVICADRVSDAMLPWVILLATVGLRRYGQQIVDDYIILIDRMRDFWASHHDYYPPTPIEATNLVSRVTLDGPTGEFDWDDLRDARNVYATYEELVNADLEGLFVVGKEVRPKAKRKEKAA